MGKRHVNLINEVGSLANSSKKNKPFKIVVVGDTDGQLSLSMIRAAKKSGRTNIEYFAFDIVNPEEVGGNYESLNRDKIRALVGSEGVKATRILGGDSTNTIKKVAGDIVIANIVYIAATFGVNKLASNLQDVLTLCNEGSVILVDSLFPSDYSKGSAFVLKSHGYLKKKGITVEEVGPADDISAYDSDASTVPPVVKMLKITCRSQAPETYFAGLATALLMEASPQSAEVVAEVIEFIPEKSFLEETVKKEEALVEEEVLPSPLEDKEDSCEDQLSSDDVELDTEVISTDTPCDTPKAEGTSDTAGCTFPSTGRGCDSDVQPVRLCENSCGKLPEEHCELPSNSCGRREPKVESVGLGELPVEPASDSPVPEERQEPNEVVEQGSGDSPAEQLPDHSSSKLGSEVSPELDKGSARGSRRRRRSGGSGDERSGPSSQPGRKD
jgi:hypothetical protein